MAKLVRPFAALRPTAVSAADVVAPPYDVVNTEEARALAAGRPRSFLHISRPEIDLPPGSSPYSDEAYAQGARSLEEFQAAHAEHQGIPWVNTMSASAEGDAWYVDSTPTPNLTPDVIAQWETSEDFVINAIKTVGAVALPGNTSSTQWVVEPGSRDPGLVPYARMPQLLRSDFIFNANDSYWLTNPLQPLTGYSPMHGLEGTPRSPRTRMNSDRGTWLSGGAGGGSGFSS